jgi:hypothetical protein
MATPIDLSHIDIATFELSPAHVVLSRFVGHWRGQTQLWFEADKAPERTVTELYAELVLGGRWLRMTYQGVAFAKPHAGEMILGYHEDPREYELAWIDSFHTGSAIMLSHGRAETPGVVNVHGSYLAGGQRWGWRTRVECPSADELILQAFNVPPNEPRQEEPAIESRLARVVEPPIAR